MLEQVILDDFSQIDPFINGGNLFEISVNKRFSKDVNINHYGKLLVKLCIENELVTLNGRTKGDFVGRFTCNTYNGSSVMDYAAVSHNLLPLINIFLVDYPTEFSDHSCLNVIMRIKKPKQPDINNHLLDKPISFIWDETKKQKLFNFMSSKKTKLDSLFLSYNKGNINLAEIDMIVNGFSKILCDSSQRILKCKKQTKNIRKVTKGTNGIMIIVLL